MQKIKIKENALVARFAAHNLSSSNVAIVFGKTIYLHGVTRNQFLQQTPWVRHEVAHVLQYKRHGFLPFLFLYIVSWIKNGYYNNRFEVEARANENNTSILNSVIFVK